MEFVPKMFTWLRRTVNEMRSGTPEAEADPGPRLIYVCTRKHMQTVRQIQASIAQADTGSEFLIRPYDWLMSQQSLPRAAYILTDFDRLHVWYHEMLGRVRDRLIESGLPVLNDPRLWLPRPAQIRTLRAAGLSDFGCWLPSHGEEPDRFPCFLRTIAAHRGTASPLLHSPDEAREALSIAMAKGRTLSDLMFVEFAGAPVPGETYFSKHAAFRIGDRILRGLTVTEAKWMAKFGTKGLAGDAFYAAELEETRQYPHAEQVRTVFETAGIEYGRVDFSFLEGRMQVYEINLNPSIKFKMEHPNSDRLETMRLQQRQLIDAFSDFAIMPEGPDVDVSDLIPEGKWDQITLKQP